MNRFWETLATDMQTNQLADERWWNHKISNKAGVTISTLVFRLQDSLRMQYVFRDVLLPVTCKGTIIRISPPITPKKKNLDKFLVLRTFKCFYLVLKPSGKLQKRPIIGPIITANLTIYS